MRNILLLLCLPLVLFSCSRNATRVEGLKEYEAVDLGLSVMWAKHNFGANKPEEFGFYQKWCNTEKQPLGNIYDLYENKFLRYNNALLPMYDAVANAWDNDWRMPTDEEWKELVDNCTWEWTQQNGVVGQRITASNGNSIFLPFTGLYDKQWGAVYTEQGFYWTATAANGGNAYAINIDLSNSQIKQFSRNESMPIRAVKEVKK